YPMKVLVVVLLIILLPLVGLIARFYPGFGKMDIPTPLPEEGLNLPVYNVIFGGFYLRKRAMGWPYFILFNEKIKFKARNQVTSLSWDLFKAWVEKEVNFSEIKEIGITKFFFLGANHLVFVFKAGGPELNVQMNKENAKKLLSF